MLSLSVCLWDLWSFYLIFFLLLLSHRIVGVSLPLWSYCERNPETEFSLWNCVFKRPIEIYIYMYVYEDEQ